MTSDKDLEPRQTGPSVGDHNQGAFSFQGGNVTADNTQGDVVGRDKITHVYNAQPKDRFPDIQIYLDLQGAGVNPLTPVTAMEHVIRDYHPTDTVRSHSPSHFVSQRHAKRFIIGVISNGSKLYADY